MVIFSNLEFGFEFTFAISVIGVVDNTNVRYACISTKPYMDETVRLKVGVHWLVSSSTTNSQ